MKTKLFEDYHTLGHNEQATYLMGLLEVLDVQRRRHGTYNEAAESRRQTTVCYTLPDGTGEFKRVCKATFLSTFAISPKKVQLLVKLKLSGSTVFKEKRGGPRTFKYTERDRMNVKNHINSFPRDVSHYTRNKSEREYLSQDLNMNRMFSAFKEKYRDSQVKYKFYRKVFLKDFPKLSFKKPRSDTCKRCDFLNIQSKTHDAVESNKAKQQLELHHRKAESALTELKNDSISSTLPGSQNCTVVMDLEKVFPLPKLTHSNMYYLRQLSCYNFNIHSTNTNDAIMCMWHEGQSGRGGNQVASCIIQAINSGLLPNHKKHLVVWSDNCAGQLKNRMLIFLYLYMVVKGIFESVQHKFLLSGHSFSVADRDFAIIEKKCRSARMQVMEDLQKVIEEARPSKPFKVLKMADHFFDFDKAASSCIDTKKLGISQISVIKVDQIEPGFVSYKKNFNNLCPWEKLYVVKKGKTLTDIENVELEQLPANVPLPENKKKDLRTMIPYLDENNRNFYRELC